MSSSFLLFFFPTLFSLPSFLFEKEFILRQGLAYPRLASYDMVLSILLILLWNARITGVQHHAWFTLAGAQTSVMYSTLPRWGTHLSCSLKARSMLDLPDLRLLILSEVEREAHGEGFSLTTAQADCFCKDTSPICLRTKCKGGQARLRESGNMLQY